MRHLARGLGALLGLLVGVVGVPIALLVLGGDLWPGSWSVAAAMHALLQPDDGRLLVGLLTLVGWLAWGVFALSVILEAAGIASHARRPRIRIPGLAGPRRFAAALLIAAIALVPTATMARAEPPPGSPVPSQPPVELTEVEKTSYSAVDRPTPSAKPKPSTAVERTPARPATVHRVQSGDDLWSLAEHYYGDGTDWRKIALANDDLLSGGPDRLQPGWKLTIPDVPETDESARDRSAHDRTAGDIPSRTTVVHGGDTLSAIAERELGDAERWPELFRANRAVLSDPDELSVGMALEIPAARSGQTTSTEPRPGAEAPPAEPNRRNAAGKHDEHKPADPAAPRTQTTGEAPRETATSPTQSGGQSGAERVPSESPLRSDPDAPEQVPAPTTTTNSDRAAAETSVPSAASTQTAPAPTASGHGSTTASPGERTEPAATSDPATTSSAPIGEDPKRTASTGESLVPIGLLAGVGGLLAAGLIGGLAKRRRLQLQARPVGRRILHPSPPAGTAETGLGIAQRPLDLETVDLALRAIAAHCLRTGAPVPALTMALLDPQSLVLTHDAPRGEAPLGFGPHPDGWSVQQSEARYLASLPGLDQAMRPYPAMVELGQDGEGRHVLVDLEQLGLLSLSGDLERAAELASAMAVELAFAPAADELILTLIGDRGGLPEALDKHNVTTTEDVDGLLDRLEARARAQRDQRPDGPDGHFRIDPDLSDPWAPEVVIVRTALRLEHQRRFVDLVRTEPRPTVAVVVVGEVADAPWNLTLGADSAAGGRLEPAGVVLMPQRLEPDAEEVVVELVTATGSLETTPAPWWADDTEPPDPPPDNLAYLARRSAGWANGNDDENGRDMAQNPVIGRDFPLDHPVLFLLGPIELLGAQGDLPPRAAKQCLEYCGWLLEHPGTTAQAMGAALLVAEGTRRSNMSRLRAWLGADAEGQAYLPDAYSGRILLHAAVSSDWQRLQILTSGGVNRTSDSGLRSALELVRGAPLADAAPGQWHWAEELRTDMISAVRDVGVELAARANEAGELDLARWAAARALAAAPGDELLIAARIRTEHLAGNRLETERLTLQLAAQARTLGVDLDPETVELLQQVMEGQVRARLA